MNATQLIADALKNDEQVSLVLEIARRARNLEERDFPVDLTSSAEVVAAIPTEQQYTW